MEIGINRISDAICNNLQDNRDKEWTLIMCFRDNSQMTFLELELMYMIRDLGRCCLGHSIKRFIMRGIMRDGTHSLIRSLGEIHRNNKFLILLDS